jgi:hypothetical protein
MSSPLAATSVATSTLTSPSRKARMTRSRSAWERSPWMARAACPSRRRPVATSSVSALVLVKTMARLGAFT